MIACSSGRDHGAGVGGRAGAADGGEVGEPSGSDAGDGGKAGAAGHGGAGAAGGGGKSGGAAPGGGGSSAVAAMSGGGAGGGGGGGGVPAPQTPAKCAASAAGDVASGKDTFAANTGKQAVSAISYTNVGATGMYAQVVSGWSKATGCVQDADGMLCKNTYRKPKSVSGSLAPFDDELRLVFGGPIELYQIAIYSPEAGVWQRDAYWDRCTSEGLVFAGNKSWYECGGFVESYVTSDGTKESASPVQFAGTVAAGTEVHVMSNGLCSGSGADSDCGWSSGLPLHGFKGDSAGSKLFAVKMRMPLGDKTPAYWILPSQVIRSSQYGCNCRGAGSDPMYKGGCGELDVAEILGGVTTSLEATTTLYSFQDITGGGSVTFARPVEESAVFLVIFDAPSRQIAIRRIGPTEFDFSSSLAADRIADWLAATGTMRALRGVP
jgi:hypothetical protein